MLTLRIAVVLMIGLLGTASFAQAQSTWYVDDDAPNDPGPGDPSISDPQEDGSLQHPYDSIEQGIWRASNGDTVLVLDGVYTGDHYSGSNKNLDFDGLDITVRSENGPKTCIIDCEGEGRAFYFNGDETEDAVVDGFTICNGVGPEFWDDFVGGGILCYFASPTVKNCVFVANTASNYGGAVYAYASSMKLLNCTFIRNRAYYGGAVYWDVDGTSIHNCTFVRNAAVARGGGFYFPRYRGNVTMTNCLLWGNLAEYGDQIALASEARLTVTYSNVQGGEDDVHVPSWCVLTWGDGNLDSDPLLTRSGIHLQSGSPCYNGGDPGGDYTDQVDVDGELRVANGRADIGADEFIDSDADGLPDWWEQAHFGAPDAGNPAGNEDSDARLNLEEYGSSSDPWRAPATFHVDVAGNDDWDGLAAVWDGEHGPKATIQAAMDATEYYEGDDVLVADGTYRGPDNRNLDFRGREIVLRSANGPRSCVIDCENEGRGFRFRSGETSASVLDGFTVMHGLIDYELGNMDRGGGGICCGFGDPLITNCAIVDNTARTDGGAIYCRISSPAFRNCVISGNIGYDAIYSYAGTPSFENCTITRNGENGIFFQDGAPTFRNCIIWGNFPYQITGYEPDEFVTYSVVQDGWPGEGNLDADPLLTWNGWHLQADSPCADMGDPSGDYSGQSDIDGETRVDNGRVDIGADEFLDADGDGLPDWWELLYFGSITAAQPDADDDDDGLVNLDEYAQRRHPLRGPATFFVDLAGDDTWDGLASEWDGQHGPKATIQAAINAAGLYEGDVVQVADGTYTGVWNRDLDFAGKVITVRSANGPELCTIDCESSGRGFGFGRLEGADSIVEGFTITNGSAERGGGVSCFWSSPTINNCSIIGNTAEDDGGGVYGYATDLIITECTIADNAAGVPTYGSGGGIECSEGNPIITNCTITGNTADGEGGGVSCGGGHATITGCTITGNMADNDGGGVSSWSDGLTIDDCVLSDNTAGYSGGAVDCHAQQQATITNCTISANVAGYDGGAIYCTSGNQPTIANCTIAGNTANDDGGGICCNSNSQPTIVNSLFLRNTAQQEGGAVACYSDSPLLANCTIVGNAALSDGGGIFGNAYSSPVLANCILWDNSPSELSGAPTVTYCDVAGGWSGDGNIDSDPRFADPNGLDGDPNTWEDNDYRLTADSPCIDAADNLAVPADTCDVDDDGDTAERTPLDFDGLTRFVDDPATDDTGVADPPDYPGVVDMGAHEFPPTDCDENGIPDVCDLDCGDPNEPCDLPGCGQGHDCNYNGVPDECDIADGTSLDENGNGIPDECEHGVNIVYSNLEQSTDPNEFYLPQSETGVPYGDDLHMIAGGWLDEFTFAYFDPPGGTALGQVEVLFYENDPDDSDFPGGDPGCVLLGSYTVADLPGDGSHIVSVGVGLQSLALPEDIWIEFDFADSLEAGLVLYDPPAVGSSANLFEVHGVNMFVLGYPHIANFGLEIITRDDEPGCPNPGASGNYCTADIDGSGDCLVNLADLAALLGAYGTCPGDALYNPDADLTDDGNACIAIADLAELLGQYGDDCN